MLVWVGVYLRVLLGVGVKQMVVLARVSGVCLCVDCLELVGSVGGTRGGGWV